MDCRSSRKTADTRFGEILLFVVVRLIANVIPHRLRVHQSCPSSWTAAAERQRRRRLRIRSPGSPSSFGSWNISVGRMDVNVPGLNRSDRGSQPARQPGPTWRVKIFKRNRFAAKMPGCPAPGCGVWPSRPQRRPKAGESWNEKDGYCGMSVAAPETGALRVASGRLMLT